MRRKRSSDLQLILNALINSLSRIENRLNMVVIIFKVKEWEERAANYRKLCQEIADMFRRVTHAPNKPLVQQLYPYIWDIKEVSMLLEAFVKWLGKMVSFI